MCEGSDDHELRRLAGRSSNSSSPPFKSCDALLENIDGRVRDPAVDVAELLEAEETRSVGGIIEDKAGGSIDWNGTGVGRWIRALSASDQSLTHWLKTRELALHAIAVFQTSAERDRLNS